MDLIPSSIWWEIFSRLDDWSIVNSVCFLLDEPFPGFENPYRVLAIEHGLVLLRCGSKSYVGNPVLMEWKEIPPIDKIFLKTDKVDEEILWSHNKVLFSVDPQKYSIYVINSDWLNDISVLYDSSLSAWRIDPLLGPALENCRHPPYQMKRKEPRSYIRVSDYKGRKTLEVITNNEFRVWEERDRSIPKLIHKKFQVDKSEWNLVAKVGIPKREEYNQRYLGSLYCFWSKEARPKLRPFVVDMETKTSYVFPRKHRRDRFSNTVFVLTGNTTPVPDQLK
ncbi:hypothetical protein SELMODRAFT_406648 [Selaginella moellendorffii]|uniref:F-box protein At3g26010-like beta-propeller domain-containing protein n=1 Tax=Selaginella moellendorffii TaxID=88036 RepID=D8R109_SELML|nr:hypothetical protein SELMODRAFT_406648 [Selaginella moellendorffii]